MSIPQHIAIIPDGNRRWAKAQGLLAWKGHEEGVKRMWEVAEAAVNAGVKYLTIWGGSYSNLAERGSLEVSALFKIMEDQLSSSALRERFKISQTRVSAIGEWSSFNNSDSLQDKVAAVELETKDFLKANLTILFGYDGQREMLAAVSSLKDSGEPVTDDNLRKHLWTGNLPDVDLVIRTGGEPHWSAGFMMWLTANSQFYFTDELWPAFTEDKLKAALEEFENRERRLGK